MLSSHAHVIATVERLKERPGSAHVDPRRAGLPPTLTVICTDTY